MAASTFKWLLVPLAAVALTATAQDAPKAKKLYCWNDPKSGRTCSDALPPDQVNAARDEFSVNSGARVGAVHAAQTAEERADAAAAAAQAQADQAAADTRKRTEQAMLLSYNSEDDLKRVFTERTALVDNSVETAQYNLSSMRDALVTKLQQAGNAELAGRPIDAKLADEIRQRHVELVRQQGLLTGFQQQRAQLSGEVEDTLQRYRAMKTAAQSPNG
ncbi:hypothetical protein SAMN05428989_3605 [Pseudoxanthomonas sp. GM95]|uniref:hypothetical protein n=1 Tax=Pseudoxanthomonas sp. GM95 TaxID=1881043 RepID=UPI0008CBF6AD|nr:hypothetical protein [Pseudoxanthomonas sp. GM95]SEM35020.1 hypothetical protein SAMN05428989_3605 [Pseudoxanthomonas sp. GM95]